MAHSELEKEIEREGYELMRLLYQDHLILRAWSERDAREQGPVVGSDGLERRHRRSETKRGMMTPFGVVEVERAGYSAPGCRSLYPLDAELNLPNDSFSHGGRERVAREVAKSSCEGTVDTLTRTTGARVGKRQAEKLAVDAARDFEEFYGTRAGPLEVFTMAAWADTRTTRTSPSPSARASCAHTRACASSLTTPSATRRRAGLAKGRRVTTLWAFCEALRREGDVEVLENVRFVHDGNVVTSAGVSAGIDMALWLVDQIHGVAHARQTQRIMEHDPAPPYAAQG